MRQHTGCTENLLGARFAEICALSASLARLQTFDDLCRAAVKQGREVLGFDRVGLWFLTDAALEVEGSYGTDESGQIRDERGCRLTCTPESDMGRVLAGGQPFVQVHDTQLLDHRACCVGYGTHVLASLWDGERLIGCLSADNLLRQHPLGDAERSLLQMYATTLAHLCTRRRAEDALCASREQQLLLLNIVNRSPAMVLRWAVDDGQHVEFASLNVSQLGYAPDDFVSGRLKWSEVIHPDDWPRLRNEIEKYRAQGGTQWARRYRLRTAKGEYRWCEGRLCVLTDAQGRVTHIEGIFIDVTKRRELEVMVARIAERERNAIGAALHDSLGQELSGLAFLAAATAKHVKDGPPEVGEALARISALASSAVSHARRIARGLAPVDMAGDGLATALSELAASTAELYRLNCQFEIREGGPIHDAAVATHLYYIAAESVNNAARHAAAATLLIELWTGAEGRLRILDDGIGLDRDMPHTGLGLHILQHRAEIIGGGLTITSSPGAGTEINCRFPNLPPSA